MLAYYNRWGAISKMAHINVGAATFAFDHAHWSGTQLCTDGPNANEIVCESSEQCLPICRPRERHTLWLLGVLSDVDEIRLQFINYRSE